MKMILFVSLFIDEKCQASSCVFLLWRAQELGRVDKIFNQGIEESGYKIIVLK